MNTEESIDLIVSSLTKIGFPRTNMDVYLHGCIGMELMEYLHKIQYGDDKAYYMPEIKLFKGINEYNLEGYHAMLIKTHPLPFKELPGLNVDELDLKMLGVDWNRPVDEVLKDKNALAVYNQVDALSNVPNKDIRDIIDRLMLRYWRDTPMSRWVDVNRNVHKYKTVYYFKINGNKEDYNLKQAYNLLAGRPVRKFFPTPTNRKNYFPQWQSLMYGLTKFFPDYDLKEVLKTLPLPTLTNEEKGMRLIRDLTDGDLVAAHLLFKEQLERVYLQADPANASVKLFNSGLVELNLKAYQLNDVQKQQFDKKLSSTKNIIKPTNNKRKGRSL